MDGSAPIVGAPSREKLMHALEIMTGTGRTVARQQTARLCRCGGSANKPFCDDTHRRIGFKAP